MNAITPIAPESRVLSHWAEGRLDCLNDVMEYAARLAQVAMQRSLQADCLEPGGRDHDADFIRMARCVRQTAALSGRLESGKFPPLKVIDPLPERTAAAPERPAPKQRIRGALEDAILNEAIGERAEDLLTDLRERLDDPDFDSDFADRPIGLIVADICRELGVRFEERRFTAEELGQAPPESAPPRAADQRPADPQPAVPSPEDPPRASAIEPQRLPRHLGWSCRFEFVPPPTPDPAPD